MIPEPFLALLIASLVLGLLWWLFVPPKGVYFRWRRGRQLSERMLQEDALKHIHQCELHNTPPTLKSLAGALRISPDQAAALVASLDALNLLSVEGNRFRLTDDGREYALHIIRAHRLWERYLADATGFDAQEWHNQAELYEHTLTRADADRLSARLGNPTHDPHGDPIPTARGEIVYRQRIPLAEMEVDRPARIIHIEDEPEAVYAQIVAEELHVGMIVRVLESTPQRIRFWAGGDEHTLAPLIAANIAVAPLPAERATAQTAKKGEPLSNLQPGEKARVIQIDSHIRGVERRRLMDLGIVPGTVIRKEMVATGGDPAAYLVRGALIALRKAQARHIRVEKLTNGTPSSGSASSKGTKTET
ncbi:MAG: hypothetical protein D6803_07050 [Anaerolineae bacterium]|nr:MAG: hypothetical protein D6803_07050 [Anaerolineae bacterium]